MSGHGCPRAARAMRYVDPVWGQWDTRPMAWLGHRLELGTAGRPTRGGGRGAGGRRAGCV